MLKLELLSTEGCHLCELAEVVLQQALAGCVVEVDWVDIAYDDQLMARYATSIPVLLKPETEEALNWPFDEAAVQQFIKGV